MNLTNIINAISREIDKELKKDPRETFYKTDVRNFFDHAASIVVTREFDKYRKMGTKKD